MKKTILAASIFLSLWGASCSSHSNKDEVDNSSDDIRLSEWNLVWADEFDGSEEDLDKRWESQNGPSGHILCSRWRENAMVSDGTLKLVNRKENRGGQEWTSGNIWTTLIPQHYYKYNFLST